tara:strand:+ start:341 stop:538 length:198 start_codon:yes stop_codon:yes gene_type:complete
LKKAVLLGSIWGVSLLISAVFRLWGHQHPEPLQPGATPVLTLLFLPSVLMAGWMLWSSRGSGESE